MRLLDRNGKEVKVGDMVTTSNGDKAKVLTIFAPERYDTSRSGRMYVQWEKTDHKAREQVYFVTVFNCEFDRGSENDSHQ